MGLEEEVNVRTELNPFPRRHREKTVVVEDRVERLDPLRVDVAVTDDPRLHVEAFAHHLPRTVCEHAVRPLAGVDVDVAKQLRAKFVQ